MNNWNPTSWQTKPALQQPSYPDESAVHAVVKEIAKLPPLVTSWEVETLRTHLAAAARGEAFVMQGGDCAESFADCESSRVAAKLKILLQMSLLLVHGTRKKVIRIGRIAGQYAKPRSADTETRDGLTLPTYRGDLVNRATFTLEARTPNPQMLMRGYERAALTLNFIRALADGGFADLHHPEYWDLEFVRKTGPASEYHLILETIRESIEFMEAVSGLQLANLGRIDFYTSHEGLALLYEQAQTRQVPHREGWFNLSTHFPWIGMRTAQADGAHVEYFRGIRNPIGVKVGPEMTAEWLTELLDILHPDDEPGRLTLIQRFGADEVKNHLPRLIEAVEDSGKTVLWISDPMHGNNETTADGIKTRNFDNILRELKESFRVHEEHGTHLGGVHFEMTGEDVTECIGGTRGVSAEDLKRDYRSAVDPRLNYEQSLEMGMLIASHLRGR